MNLITDYTDFSSINLDAQIQRMLQCFERLEQDEMSGWLRYALLPDTEDEIGRVLDAANRIRRNSETLIVVGIGGSFLGAKAIIDALSPNIRHPHPRRNSGACDKTDSNPHPHEDSTPVSDVNIVYAGQSLSAAYLKEIMELIRNTETSVNIVSKSGSTVETDIAARLILDVMKEKYGEGFRERVLITTDEHTGALRNFAEKEGLTRFRIPSDIGGRFSVFTPVGILPMAVAGIDCLEFMNGVRRGILKYGKKKESNPAIRYAAMRNHLDEKDKEIELLAVYEPRHVGLAAWWVQLFGESCGKDGKGLFPAFASYTTDLHSIGQLVQEGRRNLFETVLWCPCEEDFTVPELPESQRKERGEDYLAGKKLSEICKAAYIGTMRAHYEGGVPCIGIELSSNSASEIGELLYFFMVAVALSAYAQNLNPFDQPGVEAYKRSMREILSSGDSI